uniref:NUC153 domain-containing protein n=1 Tax=Kalanchoe fedtschenkoi TaxID=63787 RepID=A0A7N0TJJ7_KALFE
MGSSKKASSAKRKSGNKGERRSKDVVTDARFASVHSDPRFQNIPRREKKVSIDPRFDKMFTDRNFGSSAAPVDKRGRRKERKENPLQRYYQLEEEKRKDEESEESEEEEEKQKPDKVELKSGGVLEESESEEEDGLPSDDESDDMESYDSQLSDVEVDTDDEIMIGESDSDTDEQEESVPEIDQETNRLAAVNLDWHHIKAVDLYALLNSFLPDGGRIISVSVYPSEFGLQRMKEEAVRGPVGLFDEDNKKSVEKKKKHVNRSDEEDDSQDEDESRSDEEDDSQDKDENGNDNEDDSQDGDEYGNDDEDEIDSQDEDDIRNENDGDGEDQFEDGEEDEEDKDYIDARIRNYEKTRLRYYFAVVCCDSVATANHLYKECDGIEIMQSSNKLDLRYIPDSMEFGQQARDVATQVPSGYKPSDFFTKALQLSKPVLTWDEDEPERAKTLKRKFNADELDKLELNEFLASDDSESDDEDEDGGADNQPAKKHNKVDAYRSLLSGGGAEEDDDSDDEDDDGQDMEVTFNTGLEEISKRILEKRENKSETVWEAHLRKRKEKRKAKKSKKDSEEESDADNDSEGTDDFFNDGPRLKKRKVGDKKIKNNAELDKEAGASRAELELLLADDKGTDSHVKGYKIKPEKTKGMKGKEVVTVEKLPEADLDDPRFQSLFKNPLFALDPTDPQFKRSAAYRRQLAEKQKNAEQDARSAKDY